VNEFNYAQVDPAYLRQQVEYLRTEDPGTVVVDPASCHSILSKPQDERAAMALASVVRASAGPGPQQSTYGAAGRTGSPNEIVARDPEICSQLVAMSRERGVPGGPTSPLGARAMYLFADGGDTDYRIHGTTEPETIGTNVSSGCIHMVNQDVIHLYQRA
jgi:lipoprotein-anchoring transpeptidase ErfK/SrfK